MGQVQGDADWIGYTGTPLSVGPECLHAMCVLGTYWIQVRLQVGDAERLRRGQGSGLGQVLRGNACPPQRCLALGPLHSAWAGAASPGPPALRSHLSERSLQCSASSSSLDDGTANANRGRRGSAHSKAPSNRLRVEPTGGSRGRIEPIGRTLRADRLL